MATEQQIRDLADIAYRAQTTGVPTAEYNAAITAAGLSPDDYLGVNTLLSSYGYQPGTANFYEGSTLSTAPSDPGYAAQYAATQNAFASGVLDSTSENIAQYGGQINPATGQPYEFYINDNTANQAIVDAAASGSDIPSLGRATIDVGANNVPTINRTDSPTPTPTGTTTPRPTMEALTADQAAQLGQIPGIGTNVTSIMGQTSQIPDIATGVTGLGTSLGTLGNRLGVSAPSGETATVPANQNLASYLAGQIGTGTTTTTGAVTSAQTALEELLRQQAGQTRTDILGRLGTFEGGDLATRLNAGFTGITGGGTDTLRSLGQGIGTVGANLTSGIGTLTGGQANISEALLGPTGSGGGISGALADLAASTGEYQTASTQARRDLQESVLGGQERISGQIDRGDVRSQLGQIAQNVSNLGGGPQQDFGAVAQALAANVPAQTNAEVVQRAQFIQLMDNLRGLVNNPQSGLDPTVRATYASVTNAFGPNGQFIAQSSNPSTGEITRRQMTPDKQLRVQNFNQMGQPTNNPISFDINTLLSRATGQQAQAPMAQQSGLMGPQGPSITV
jgi:hypothetical protein